MSADVNKFVIPIAVCASYIACKNDIKYLERMLKSWLNQSVKCKLILCVGVSNKSLGEGVNSILVGITECVIEYDIYCVKIVNLKLMNIFMINI